MVDSPRHGDAGVQLLNYFVSRNEAAMEVEGVRRIRRLVLDDVLDVFVSRETEAVVHGENLLLDSMVYEPVAGVNRQSG